MIFICLAEKFTQGYVLELIVEYGTSLPHNTVRRAERRLRGLCSVRASVEPEARSSKKPRPRVTRLA